MAKGYNRVRFTSTTAGTGAITVGAAISGYRTPAGVSMADQSVVRLFIEDGTAWEDSICVYTSATTSFTRTLIESSTGALLALTGAQTCFVGPGAEDVVDQPIGQCRLVWTSSTQITLQPYGGDIVRIDKRNFRLPPTGVVATSSGTFVNGASSALATNRFYYVYLFNNAGTLALDFSTTGFAIDTNDGNVGVAIKSGDSTRTLVGFALTNAVPNFLDTAASRLVYSWFNKRPRRLFAGTTSNVSIAANAWTELDSTARVQFLVAAGDSLWVGANFNAFPGPATFDDARGSIGFDGVTAEDFIQYAQSETAGSAVAPFSGSIVKDGLSEGNHYATLIGFCGQTGNQFYGTAAGAGALRCTIYGQIWC